jgi:aldehyde:ferredoxin oxidoreductase
LDQAILEYYRVREWDESGRPTEKLIKRLGMGEFAGE